MPQLIGLNKKVPFNFKNYNFTFGGFPWAWSYVDDNGVLSMESGIVHCKDHLMDMILSSQKRMTVFDLDRHTDYDSPLNIVVFLDTGLDPEKEIEAYQQSIANLLHPLERDNKWKLTTVEYVDTYNIPQTYSKPIELTVIKLSASKMWRRNAFLGSIWASFVRMAFYNHTLTPENFIDVITQMQLTGCNEFMYIKQQAPCIKNYKERWDTILKNLSKFKQKAEFTSLHKDLGCRGHGTDGAFYGFSLLRMNNPDYLHRWYKSHPFSSFIITEEDLAKQKPRRVVNY